MEIILNDKPLIKVYNADCMEILKNTPDKFYDLAVVDPPYGINMSKGIEVGKYKRSIHKQKDWDNKKPKDEYFKELFRISKNQIIWGANYFIEHLKNTKCFIFWDKKNGSNFMSDGELAWTSFNSKATRFVYNHIQEYNIGIDRIHPTQKPKALYDWIFSKYAKPNDKILDTHLGSGSSAISAYYSKLDFTGIELDSDYFNSFLTRYKKETRQLSFL